MKIEIDGHRVTLDLNPVEAMKLAAKLMTAAATATEHKFGNFSDGFPMVMDGRVMPGVFTVSCVNNPKL